MVLEENHHNLYLLESRKIQLYFTLITYTEINFFLNFLYNYNFIL